MPRDALPELVQTFGIEHLPRLEGVRPDVRQGKDPSITLHGRCGLRLGIPKE
jgi:hypothetical protein